MTETLYTVEEAAERLKMHPDTLRRQLRQGRIKSVRTGKLWRIPESVLIAPESAQKPTSSAPELYPPAFPEVEEPDLTTLFAPPTPEEIARRLDALKAFESDEPTTRGQRAQRLINDAVARAYDERAAQLMEGHR